MTGTGISVVEVAHISGHGFWLDARGEELFLAFRDFPWFEEASIRALSTVEEVSPGHFFWPALDIDLDLDTIRHPGHYPLVDRG